MGKTFSTGLLTNGIWQDSSNNIGIGAAPSGSYKFEVTGTGRFSSTLNITTNGNPLFLNNSTNTTSIGMKFTNAGGNYFIGVSNSGGTGYLSGSAYAFNIQSEGAQDLQFGTNNINRLIINATTGAATFSSSVTAQALDIISASGVGSSTASGLARFITAATTPAISIGQSSNARRMDLYSYVINVTGEEFNLTTIDSQPIKFNTAATLRMIITGSGNVGIGTTSPDQKLTIQAAGTANGLVSFKSAAGTTTSFIGVPNANGDVVSTSTPADICLRNETGNILFATNGNTERMRITSGGYLKASNNGSYLGSTGSWHEFTSNNATNFVLSAYQTSTSFDNAILYIRSVRNTVANNYYAIQYYHEGAGAYKFQVADSGNVTNTNNSYGAISDIKLKENITDATPKLNDLLKVKVKNFNFIGSEEKQLGVIAQELEEIFPSMIDEREDFEEIEVTDEDGNVNKERQSLGTTTKSVKYSVFVPMLIKAIQEQQAQIEELKQIVATINK